MEEIIQTVAIGLVSAILTAVSSSNWWQRLKRGRHGKGIEMIEAGVQGTYEATVKDLKAASSDGKLTPTQRKAARKDARHRAVELGKKHGINVLREIGPDLIDNAIEAALRRAKGTMRKK